jgi:hypothetical protein
MSPLDPIHDAIMSIACIRDETLDCIDLLKKDVAGATSGLDAADEAKLIKRLDAYIVNLKIVAEAQSAGLKKQLTLAKKRLLYSPDARLFAVLRALIRSKGHATLSEVIHLAGKLDVWQPLPEPVIVFWAEKPKGGYRLIVMFGPMRTAHCLMVRDMMSMMGIDSPIDFTRKGGGGEQGLTKAICKDIEDGYDWWWTPDIKNCFGSIRPGHFGWLPIDRRLLKNVMFLPKCAKIEIAKHGKADLIIQYLHATYPDLSVNGGIPSLHHLTVQIVRRGLPQGSVLSPLLARAVIAREVNAALPVTEIKRYSYCDDLSIGAQTKGLIKAAKQAVTKRFSSLSAGPIELHDTPVIDANSGRLVVLGYRFEPGNGHGDNYVHVKPWGKRINNFRRRLTARLEEAEKAPSDSDPFEVAEKYRKPWFAAQRGWTKVPEQSDDVSQCITMTYVHDFIHGIPMGVWKVNKPKPTNVGDTGSK